jgi:hypothetical protein
VTPLRLLQNTIAHELGHSMGLKHHPAEVRDLKRLLGGKKINLDKINPVFYRPNFRNLMFPTSMIASDMLNGAQVEDLHHGGNLEFRNLEFDL